LGEGGRFFGFSFVGNEDPQGKFCEGGILSELMNGFFSPRLEEFVEFVTWIPLSKDKEKNRA
jgi:hypothetical protein